MTPPRLCEGCKYWSELLAHGNSFDGVYAICLHPERPREYVRRACDRFEQGTPVDLIAWDDPDEVGSA